MRVLPFLFCWRSVRFATVSRSPFPCGFPGPRLFSATSSRVDATAWIKPPARGACGTQVTEEKGVAGISRRPGRAAGGKGSGGGSQREGRKSRPDGGLPASQRIWRRARSFAARVPFGYSTGAMAEERSVGREYLEALIIAAVFLLFTNTFVVQTFYIPSGSRVDTILIGDPLFVNRFIYGPTATGAEKALPFRPVHRGDIVVFRSPEDPKLDLVKRCVAVGGDTVQVINAQLHINGKAVQDPSHAVHKNPEPVGLFVDP